MPYKFRDFEKKLKKLWYIVVRQKWSHVLFSDWKNTFPVPNHAWKDISPWVESKVFGIIWISKSDFDSVK